MDNFIYKQETMIIFVFVVITNTSSLYIGLIIFIIILLVFIIPNLDSFTKLLNRFFSSMCLINKWLILM